MKLVIISALVAVACADAGADADANHPAGHAVIHHGHGYTPAPAPYGHQAYSPAPAYVDPYAPAPVHHAVHDPYAPAPYAAHPAPHHPAPHHPAPYHPAPHHPAPHHPKPAPHHEAVPPKCSVDNPKSWCLETPDYPTYEIEAAITYHYDSVQQMYKDVLANTDNSVDRLKEIVEETYLCPSETAYIQPVAAVNVNGKWRFIVNNVKAHYETLTQTARIEECTTAGEACPLVPECYETKCLQKSIYHRFLVYDAYDHYLPFAIESFKLPSACACYNGAYVEPPHRI